MSGDGIQPGSIPVQSQKRISPRQHLAGATILKNRNGWLEEFINPHSTIYGNKTSRRLSEAPYRIRKVNSKRFIRCAQNSCSGLQQLLSSSVRTPMPGPSLGSSISTSFHRETWSFFSRHSPASPFSPVAITSVSGAEKPGQRRRNAPVQRRHSIMLSVEYSVEALTAGGAEPARRYQRT